MKKNKSIVLEIALCAVMLFAAAGCVFVVETPDNEGGKDNTATTPEVLDVTPDFAVLRAMVGTLLDNA